MDLTRRAHLRHLGGVGAAIGGGLLGGCLSSSSQEHSHSKVRVGSKPFAEQKTLGYIAYERLTDVEGIQAVDEIGYGGSLENWNAVSAGTKDIYWEYTGTAWLRLPPYRDERITHPEQLYEKVEADARERGIRMAPPASFSNEWIVVADRGWSERTGVTTLSDFTSYVTAGNTGFGVAFNEDFYHRPDAWKGLADYYGIGSAAREAIQSGTFIVTSAGLTYELLASSRIQVASGFATNPQPERESVVELSDDRNYFLPYQPAPTAHARTIAQHSDIFEALAPIAAALDEATMRRLNRQVIVEDRTPKAVAAGYLNN